MPEALLASVHHMVVANDVLNLVAKQVPETKPTNANHMEAANDALNLVA